MTKPVVFYFVHAHGNGHRATFNLLHPALSEFFKIVAITTNHEITEYLLEKHDVEVVELPPKYPVGYHIPDPTFTKAFEVTPYLTEPALRARALAEAIAHYRPRAFYCDGVPELAIMVRGMGVPVVLVHLPGDVMGDPTQVFAHELADNIVAHFPASMEQPDYPYSSKTYYSGYMSQFSGSDVVNNPRPMEEHGITVLLGYDNWDARTVENMTGNSRLHFTLIGNKKQYKLGENCNQLGRIENISLAITGSVVISAAGQNTVSELLSLGKRLILLPESRPYNEQMIHAAMLARQNAALLANDTFTTEQWQNLLHEARSFAPTCRGLVNDSAPAAIAQKMRNWYA